ncbi:MAG: hypothetical protein KatS3mg027_2300 [Bacteroidia bacterium]|nr:MAG: hypothetical protein KatS3mg027_2300 [Bacteroidia bacterium]
MIRPEKYYITQKKDYLGITLNRNIFKIPTNILCLQIYTKTFNTTHQKIRNP